ncbi:MAG: XdhC family protein, partial [Pyrinomonadaceae bacterium]|nr:XdhC family protein [Pyrinomonadaceae bacterium]
HVVDHRPKYANLDRFRMADVVAHPPRERLVDAKAITKNSVAVVMNHNLELDSLVLKELLATKAAYIGVMGPKVRTEQMLTDIAASGVKIPENSLKRLYGPVGLDIGATTPEGIALSILAEIQAVLSGRTGGFLKRRKGSIYGE